MASIKKVAFHTLGCKLNFAETSTIANLFGKEGFTRVDFSQQADIYIINTCSVTESANKKCRQTVKKAINTSPDAMVVVIGCYAQLKPKEIIDIPGVDLVLGANEKFNILNYLNNLEKFKAPQIHSCEIEEVRQFVPSYSFGDRTRSFLKVQDGCDYPCSYCTIPMARGKSRNDTIANTIEQAKQLAKKGIKEVVLTGVNIGDYGKTTGEQFINLIKQLDDVVGIDRFRISSIEPNLLSDEIIEFVASSKRFVPHFHIPLQSGSDHVLKLMKRRYNTDLYTRRVQRIKKLIPHAAIGVDVIVGFPGETEDEFLNTYNYLNNLDVTYLHVFSYSERPNTAAVNISPKIDAQEIDKRSKMLQILSDKKRRYFYELNLGNSYKVLFEGKKDGQNMFGFTENYIKVETDFNHQLINQIKDTTLNAINESGNVMVDLA